jgi:transposase
MSDIIKSINEQRRQNFLTRWAKKVLNNDYLCYDITSVSSYSELNEYVRYGYNRDGEKLGQINLAMLFGQINRLPVYYHRLPGNINDVSTVHNLLETFSFLELPKVHLVMDKGFYSQKNVDELLEAGNRFTIAVPIHNKWVRQTIDQVRDVMYGPVGYRRMDEEILYVHTGLKPWGEKRYRCYLHLYFNSHAAANHYDGFTEELLNYMEELENGRLVLEHQEAYDEYFIIKETPVRGRKVSYNNDAIEKHRNKYVGFFAILSNGTKDPREALRIYRDKDAIEKTFDDLKSQLDMKRLRIHSSAAMDGRLFVQFISLIYISAIRRRMRQTKLIERFAVREMLEELDTIVKVKYSGKYGQVLTEVSKTQRQILGDFNVDLPS